LKLATSHVCLHLQMYNNYPPHLNYATTLPCENYNIEIRSMERGICPIAVFYSALKRSFFNI